MSWFSSLKEELLEVVEEGHEAILAENRDKEAREESELSFLKEAYEKASTREMFSVALGAPYRELFIGGLREAEDAGYPAYELLVYAVTEEMQRDLRDYLRKDFGIFDESSLIRVIMGIEAAMYLRVFEYTFDQKTKDEMRMDLDEKELKDTTDRADEIHDVALSLSALVDKLSSKNSSETINGETLMQHRNAIHEQCLALKIDVSDAFKHDQDLIALGTARISYVSAGAVGARYITRETAEMCLRETVKACVPLFSSWDEYADAYLRGEKEDKANNVFGRMILEGKTKALQESEQSPWNIILWPDTVV